MSDDVSPPTSNVQSQFSLLHLFVVISLVALLCAPAAYVGWPGLIGAGAFFAAAVGYALLSPKLKLVEILIVFGVVVGLIVLLLPVVDAPRVPSYRNWCMNNLSQLAFAMHLYHDEHGSLPPAYIADASGHTSLKRKRRSAADRLSADISRVQSQYALLLRLRFTLVWAHECESMRQLRFADDYSSSAPRRSFMRMRYLRILL